MACKPISTRTIQREEPPIDGGGWSTEPCTIKQYQHLTVRGRFTVFGSGEDCPAWMHFQYSRDGGATWSDFNDVKTALPGIAQWYEVEYFAQFVGTIHLRLLLSYDGSQYSTGTALVLNVESSCREGVAVATTMTEGVALTTTMIEGVATPTEMREGVATPTVMVEGVAPQTPWKEL